MSWKKHFQSPSAAKKYQKLAARYADDALASAPPNSYSSRFASWLPEVYSGQPNRIERYSQYDNMDLDTEINMALDTIADSSTQSDPKSGLPFLFEWESGVTEEETELLKEMLRQWVAINEFDRRIWKLFRSTLKYGDTFFIRDPETYKLFWVSADKIDSVIVDESKGKDPEQYVIRDLDVNLQTLVASGNLKRPADQRGYSSGPLASGQFGGAASYGAQNSQTGTRFGKNAGGYTGQHGLSYHVDADNVIHVSLSEGLDNVWPFGISILENVFKTFKQKELIEDAVIIYRVQRAPERRVFYVDIGRMPTHRAMAYLERVKNEIQQKRIPSRTGGQNNILDATYNPMCLILKEKIPLLDGRTLTLEEIIKEHEKGKQNWVYSCNPETGEIVPGLISWAGTTRKNTQVIRLTFDNGKTLTCTPDHKIPVKGKGFIEAKNLTENDSLFSFETRNKAITSGKKIKDRTYTQIFDHKSKKWTFAHRMVGEFFREKEKHQTFTFLSENINKPKILIHHVDFDRYNNNPENLVYMDKEDHLKYHSYHKKEYWNNISEEETDRIKNKIRHSLKETRDGYTEEYIQYLTKARSIGSSAAIQKMKKEDPEKFRAWQNQTGHSLSIKLALDEKLRQKFINNIPEEEKKRPWRNQKTVYPERMLQIVVEEYNHLRKKRRNLLVEALEKNAEFMDLYEENNKPQSKMITKVDTTFFNTENLYGMLKKFGYNNWKLFKENVENYNHRIVSIEYLDEKQDVGTITVDGNEQYHNYHTFAIDSGIFIKNSMLEDYFFAQNSDGKGSRVETLPGGDQLGQIDDLKYFHHKLRTGLRIPRSYMPDFDDGGGAVFNDGRVGTAYIEELRFTKYCERLQALLIPHLDMEFKLFCKFRGVNVHSSLFGLKFTEPQNFSKYRQTEVDGAVLNVYSTVADIPHISRRFGLMKYAGWTEDEVLRNERMWAEENSKKVQAAKAGEMVTTGNEDMSFSDVGATASGLSTAEGGTQSEEGAEDVSDTDAEETSGLESPISGAEAEKRNQGAEEEDEGEEL